MSDHIDMSDGGAGAEGADAMIDIRRVLSLFDDDPKAKQIVIGMMDGARGEELQSACGLTQLEYEAKRKKIRRRIEKLFQD
jgi:hypothetical protein